MHKVEMESFMRGLVKRNPGESEFHQAVREVMETLIPFAQQHRQYADAQILERLTEPDRIVIFRVTWEDDNGDIRANRAWRVQFNNAIGPYKGGMRFHPSVTQSVLKFLAFEQVFKNSLTGLPMGAGKGGSNFNPKGKSDREVMRFCQSLMTELYRHIGEDTDVPAGDIGVGSREVSFLFGQYKRLANRFVGAITGKGIAFGGSRVRREATGYGAVFFMEEMLAHIGTGIEGKRAVVSGSGNVALYCIEKLVELGASVVAASDSSGAIYVKDGINREMLGYLKTLKEVERGRISEMVDRFPKSIEYFEGASPWRFAADLAFPCATQNELDLDDAEMLIKNGLVSAAEGANMPCTISAVHAFSEAGVLFAPGKAANAGGVAVSGLEQSQNALRLGWSHEEVEQRLVGIMREIHAKCVEHGASGDRVDYVKGANIAGFIKVADAMIAYGVM